MRCGTWDKMKPQRIALLSPYTNPITGGISSYTRELSAAYVQRGISCIGIAAAGESNSNFTVVPGGKLVFCFRALRSLTKWEPDIIHGHSQHWYIILAGLLGKLLNPSAHLLFTFHTPPDSTSNGAIDSLVRSLLRFSDGVVFVSREMRDLAHLPPSIRQAVILAAPERLAVSQGMDHQWVKRPNIVFVGPLVWPQKVAGVLLLVDAFAEISRSFPDWRLIIIGDGPLRPSVESRVGQLRLSGRVVLKGFVESVFDEIGSAEIYAHISLQEGLPLALLDAMVIGTAVIATPVGGIPEVIRHVQTGFLVEPNNDSLVAGLGRLMRDWKLRETLAAAAKEYGSKHLSWDKVAEQHLRFAVEERP